MQFCVVAASGACSHGGRVLRFEETLSRQIGTDEIRRRKIAQFKINGLASAPPRGAPATDFVGCQPLQPEFFAQGARTCEAATDLSTITTRAEQVQLARSGQAVTWGLF